MTDLVGVNLIIIIIITYDAERSGKGKSRHFINFHLTDLAIAEKPVDGLGRCELNNRNYRSGAEKKESPLDGLAGFTE